MLADQREQTPRLRDALELVLAAIVEPRSEPATRSLTVLETSTSPGAASDAMRAPIETAMPATLPSLTSHSPVWRPARNARSSSPSGRGSPPRRGRREPGHRRQRRTRRRPCRAPCPGTAPARAGRSRDAARAAPASRVAEPRRELGRADDVGEEDGREDPLRVDAFGEPRDEARVAAIVARCDVVVYPCVDAAELRQLDDLRSSDPLGGVVTGAGIAGRGMTSVGHELPQGRRGRRAPSPFGTTSARRPG